MRRKSIAGALRVRSFRSAVVTQTGVSRGVRRMRRTGSPRGLPWTDNEQAKACEVAEPRPLGDLEVG